MAYAEIWGAYSKVLINFSQYKMKKNWQYEDYIFLILQLLIKL